MCREFQLIDLCFLFLKIIIFVFLFTVLLQYYLNNYYVFLFANLLTMIIFLLQNYWKIRFSDVYDISIYFDNDILFWNTNYRVVYLPHCPFGMAYLLSPQTCSPGCDLSRGNGVLTMISWWADKLIW